MEMITIGGVTLPKATPEQLALNVARWRAAQEKKAKLKAQSRKVQLTLVRHGDMRISIADMIVRKALKVSEEGSK